MGEFSGIDAKAFNDMTGAFKTDKDRLRQGATWIKASFERYGIDAQPLTELLAICGWLDDQTPMLTRRYHLAVAAEHPYPGFKNALGGPLVSIDESQVGTAAEAAKNGRKLGDKAKEALGDANSIPADLMAALEQNAGDGDYVTAFYNALGPDNLARLSNTVGSPFKGYYHDHPEEQSHARDTLAKTLGTFTQIAFDGQSQKEKQASWNKWLDAFVPDSIHPASRLDFLMPLLKGGTQDKDFLVALGDRVFDKTRSPGETEFMKGLDTGGPWGSDHYTQLFDAIATNPEASGEWFDHNHDTIQELLYPAAQAKRVLHLEDPKSRVASFIKVAHCATIELRATNEQLAEKNTARLLMDNYLHTQSEATKGIHPVAGTDYLYSEIISSYWKDLEYGVTSPVSNQFWGGDIKTGEAFTEEADRWDYTSFLAQQDTSRQGPDPVDHLTRGIEAGAPVWQALLGESARDPKAAGRLSALFDAYRNQSDSTIAHTERSSDDAIKYLAMQRGMMMKAYSQAFTSAQSSLEGDAGKWAEDVNTARTELIELASGAAKAGGTAGIQGGPAAGATAAADVGKEYLMGMVDDTAKELLTDWLVRVVTVKPEQAPDRLAQKYRDISDSTLDTGWQAYYQSLANRQLEVYPPSNPKGGFNKLITEPVQVNIIGTRQVTYSGNPLDRDRKYITGPADNFLNENGTVMDMEEMKKFPRKLGAYSRWLQDYAVVTKVQRDGFANGQMMKEIPDS